MVLVAVVPRLQAVKILETIASRAAIPHMAYWIEPIEAFGRLVPAGGEDISVEQRS